MEAEEANALSTLPEIGGLDMWDTVAVFQEALDSKQKSKRKTRS